MFRLIFVMKNYKRLVEEIKIKLRKNVKHQISRSDNIIARRETVLVFAYTATIPYFAFVFFVCRQQLFCRVSTGASQYIYNKFKHTHTERERSKTDLYCVISVYACYESKCKWTERYIEYTKHRMFVYNTRKIKYILKCNEKRSCALCTPHF